MNDYRSASWARHGDANARPARLIRPIRAMATRPGPAVPDTTSPVRQAGSARTAGRA